MVLLVGGGVFSVQSLMEGDKATLTSTWQEIHDAAAAGNVVIIYYTERIEVGIEIATLVTRSQGKYVVYTNFILPGDGTPYACDSPTDYPYTEST